MTTTAAERHDAALAVIEASPDRFDWRDRAQLDLLKEQINPDLSDDEFALFVQVAKHTGLDPFRRQIYGIKRQGKLTIQTGIDGYRAIAARTGAHAGTDDATFHGKSENKQFPGEATVTVYKIVSGLRVPYTATARWDEYKPDAGSSGRGDVMWRKMPHNMLAKCAEALALRKAFPEELAGIDAEEAVVDIGPRTIQAAEREQTRDEVLADRFAALPIAAKVAFTAWVQAEQIPPPGTRDDDDLDKLEAQLDKLERDSAAADAESPMPAVEGETCAHCDAAAVQNGLCGEHQLPPDAVLDQTLHVDGCPGGHDGACPPPDDPPAAPVEANPKLLDES